MCALVQLSVLSVLYVARRQKAEKNVAGNCFRYINKQANFFSLSRYRIRPNPCLRFKTIKIYFTSTHTCIHYLRGWASGLFVGLNCGCPRHCHRTAAVARPRCRFNGRGVDNIRHGHLSFRWKHGGGRGRPILWNFPLVLWRGILALVRRGLPAG